MLQGPTEIIDNRIEFDEPTDAAPAVPTPADIAYDDACRVETPDTTSRVTSVPPEQVTATPPPRVAEVAHAIGTLTNSDKKPPVEDSEGTPPPLTVIPMEEESTAEAGEAQSPPIDNGDEGGDGNGGGNGDGNGDSTPEDPDDEGEDESRRKLPAEAQRILNQMQTELLNEDLGQALLLTDEPFGRSIERRTVINGEPVIISNKETRYWAGEQRLPETKEDQREQIQQGEAVITAVFKSAPDQVDSTGSPVDSRTYCITKPSNLSPEEDTERLAALSGVDRDVYEDALDRATIEAGRDPNTAEVQAKLPDTANDLSDDRRVVVVTTSYTDEHRPRTEVVDSSSPTHARRLTALRHKIENETEGISASEPQVPQGVGTVEDFPRSTQLALEAVTEINAQRKAEEQPPLTVEQIAELTKLPVESDDPNTVSAADVHRLDALTNQVMSWDTLRMRGIGGERVRPEAEHPRTFSALSEPLHASDTPDRVEDRLFMQQVMDRYVRHGDGMPRTTPTSRARELHMLAQYEGLIPGQPGKTYAQIAQAEGINTQAANNIVNRARDRLRHLIRRMEEES